MPERTGRDATYETGIFFNCPFDQTYKPIFDALVFAAFDCGYVPRCALELDDARGRNARLNSAPVGSRLRDAGNAGINSAPGGPLPGMIPGSIGH
jgi:hypothetical protein